MENRARRDEFFDKLNALIAEFPEVTSVDEDDQFSWNCGFDKDSPSITTGIVLAVTIRNMDDFEQIFWTTPYGQSHFLTKGMVSHVVEML